MRIETIILNEKRNVTLTAYLQEVKGYFNYIVKRPAVLVIPGGGYQYCSDREAEPVAMAYLKAGYQVFILRYSIKEQAVWPNPLNDYEQAMELIRSREEEWHLYQDKVAVVGFSAGGHLAGCAAAMAKNKPDAAILGYAVTRKETIETCEKTAPDVVSAVNSDTCPCFVFATCNDQLVPIINSLELLQALAKHGVTFESHIYAFGPHGFSTGDTSVQHRDTVICSRVPNWVDDSIGWLRDILGDFGNECMTKPVCGGHVSGDYDRLLSLECTFGYLRKHRNAEHVMGPLLEWLDLHKEEVSRSIGPAAYEVVKKKGMEGFCLMADNRTLKEILENTKFSMEEKERINSSLKKIPNI